MKYNQTILLIDDDTDDHEIFSLALEKAEKSASCIFANDGLHALEKINSDETLIPDYIFIDMNMPRMNGQQCLSEIKKIARLKDVPVFMYSTSADAAIVEENKKLGAVDVIIKPSDISVLTRILSNIISKNVVPIVAFLFAFVLVPQKGFSQRDSLPAVNELKKLSVEDLMNITVTSVSKTSEKLTEVASAIQVVTGEEISRSGTLRLPGALRLATNMQVTQSGSHDVRITSRGFSGLPVANSSLANKLLVLIDGRTVYTPLFGGVYWDVQNVLMEDVKQIEVISGPGGSLWGANAVNGIVNVISKTAKETQGVYATISSGTRFNDFGAVRYGGHVDSTLFYRVYGQRFDFKSSIRSDGSSAGDSWNNSQGGFRMDYIPSAKSNFTLQGDLYGGKEDDSISTLVNGQNLLARWTQSFSNKSGLVIQTYFDRTYRNIKVQNFRDELSTYDFDLQHNFSIGKRNSILWGLGYRLAKDNSNSDPDDRFSDEFTPQDKTLQLFSGFVQDQIALIRSRLALTVGTKITHNDYTGFEFQPTIRLAFTPTEMHTVWTAVSRAVRTPSRFDTELPGATLGSYGDFKSENVIAYELGYRIRPLSNLSFSIATYYNQYTHLRSVNAISVAPPVYFYGNNLKADTYGVEVSAKVVATSWWKLIGGYTFLHENFNNTSDSTYIRTDLFEANDAKNQFLIQSDMDIAKYYQLDVVVRYVDLIPAGLGTPSVPSYITFDLRIGFQYKWLTLSVNGSNLADKFHDSSANVKSPRSVFGKIEARF